MARHRVGSDWTADVAANSQPVRGPGLSRDGLPQRPPRARSDSLPLREYASSTCSESTSPVLPNAFYEKSGTLRVPGGLAPVLPGDERSPFRFLEPAEDVPPTPMDISPVTPVTPRLLLQDEYQPLVASSSPVSPSYRAAEFQLHTGLLPTEKRSIPLKSCLKTRRPSDHNVSSPHVAKSTPLSGCSSPHQHSHQAPFDDERHATRMANSSTPVSLTSSDRSNPSRSRSPRRGRSPPIDCQTSLNGMSTRSSSPPHHRLHPGGISRNASAASDTRNLQVHPVAQHARKHSASTTCSTSPRLNKSNDFDFAAAAAARKALNEEEPGRAGSSTTEQLQQSYFDLGPRPKSSRSASGGGRQISYPIARTFTRTASTTRLQQRTELPQQAPEAPRQPPERPRVLPTPNPPAIVRLGSKLKSEIKGALVWRSELSEPSEQKKVKHKKLEVKHWTELDY